MPFLKVKIIYFQHHKIRKLPDLEIAGFNHQNVLQFLEIKETSEAEGKETELEVLFEGIFGVSAKFRCEAISIESVTPYERKTA